MTSYAPSVDSALVRQFHFDVQDSLATHVGVGAQAGWRGYWFDPDDSADGRSAGVAVAAAVPAMLVLLSAAYLDDVDCRRELAVFAQRERNRRVVRDSRSSMVCLKWTADTSVPLELAGSVADGSSSSPADLRWLILRGDDHYDALVGRASELLLRAQANRLSPLEGDIAARVAAGYNVIKILPPAPPDTAPLPDVPPTIIQQRPPEPDFAFFLSHHTRPADERLITQFNSQLEIEIRRRVRSPSRGFLAPRDIRAGAVWRRRLYHAAGTTPVLIPLLTEEYFDSGWCGWEWAVFRHREDLTDQSENAAGIVLPIVWLPIDFNNTSVPSAIDDVQRIDLASFSTHEYERPSCLADFMRLDPIGYERFRIHLANRVKELVSRPAPSITEPEVRAVPPAFGRFSPGDGPEPD